MNLFFTAHSLNITRTIVLESQPTKQTLHSIYKEVKKTTLFHGTER